MPEGHFPPLPSLSDDDELIHQDQLDRNFWSVTFESGVSGWGLFSDGTSQLDAPTILGNTDMLGSLTVGTTGGADEIRVRAAGATNEGGQITLEGAGTYPDMVIDVYQDTLRIHSAGVVLVSIDDDLQHTLRGSVVPAVDNSYDLGSSSLSWESIYAFNIRDESGSLVLDTSSPQFAKGIVQATSRTTNLTGLGAGPTDIINPASATFESGRWYRISGYISEIERTASGAVGDRASIDIYNGTSTVLARSFVDWEVAADDFGGSMYVVYYTNSLSGAKDIRLRYRRVSGSFTASVRASTTERAYLVIEDLGV